MRPIRHAVVLAAGLLAAALVVPLSPGTPSASAAPPGYGPDCGGRVAKPGGGSWTCTLADYFSGTSLDNKYWVGMDLYGAGDQCVRNTSRTVAVSGGALRLTARATDASLTCPTREDGTRGSYAGAWVSSYYRFSQQYGRFEARMRVTDADGPGLHEAFWMWPDTRYSSDADWPYSGEIDVAETYSSAPELAIPFLHYSDDEKGPVDGLNTAWDCSAPRGLWHTYTLEWTSSRLTILVDGKTCLVNTAGASSFQKRFIIAFSQVLGGGPNQYDGSVPLPATTEVDYVKVWR
ncbi:glycoside hydrolase family 16 protein [Nocardioides sp. LML1-1-1.1]|uniref:glycoside hydrolase family 16 protein n=1 Tax=Nocardioides sp. LML1-1-1.1 TaxID=3135248 RepID=UPI0034451F99